MVNVFFTSTLSKVNEVLKVVVLIACEADLCTYEKYLIIIAMQFQGLTPYESNVKF